MPIFFSYSHQDRQFVDKLAHQLVQNNVRVWVDRWELHVGDSLLSKVQGAITGASALLVVLSQASVTSAWCQKEINGGLLRELEERRVIVLPVLVQDCQIPVFLREKIYADFRTDFDAGLQTILEAIARISNAATGRIDESEYYFDWALDWGIAGEHAMFNLTIISQAVDQPYTVLSKVEILANGRATMAYEGMTREDRVVEAQKHIIGLVVHEMNTPEELVFLLEDQFKQGREYRVVDGICEYYVRVVAQRLGADTGRDVRVEVGDQFRQLLEQMIDVTAQPAP